MTISIETGKLNQLVQAVAPGSALLQAWPLRGGISAEMTAFEIQRPSGQLNKMILRQPSEMTLRRNPRAAEDEFKVLQLTTSLRLATQTPYFLDQSGQIFPNPYLVIEYIEGEPEFSLTPASNFTFQLAEQLAKIHNADCSSYDMSFLPQTTNSCDEVISLDTSNTYFALEVERISDRLKPIMPFPQRNACVLLHGDYWPGNILWREDKLVAVVDWEDAKLGDPLIDFAISRLDVLWIFGPEALQSFTNAYKSMMDIDYSGLPYWDLCAALRLARLIGTDLGEWTVFFIPLGRRDITEETVRAHFQFFVRQALEELAIQ